MECDAALTQRLIEERREDEHEERRPECHHVVQKPQADGYGDERNRERRDKLERKRGDKGEA